MTEQTEKLVILATRTELWKEAEKAKAHLENIISELKRQIVEVLEKYDVDEYNGDCWSAKQIPENTQTTIDLDMFEKKEKECFNDIRQDYPKVIKVDKHWDIKMNLNKEEKNG